jgi:hypothetical protein
MEKLLKDLYVSALDRAEKILRPDKRGDAWRQFRFGILNLGNDKIRQLSDRLEDYSIEFRPAIFSVEYKVDVPDEKLVEFTFSAKHADSVSFQITSKNVSVIDAIVEALGEPERRGADRQTTLAYCDYVGLYTAFHRIIPFFDKNDCFRGQTLERYNDWKEKVYSLEKANA